MDIEPSWTRPTLNPRTRRLTTIAGILALGLFSGGLIAGRALKGDRTVVATSIAPPTIITVPAPAPIVTVRLPDPPPPPPPVVAPVVEPVPPRALAPRLWPQCVLPSLFEGSFDERRCGWDRGFPAISGDGSLIATAYVPDDGGSGSAGLTIRFIETSTSRVVRSALVLSPDEVYQGTPARDTLGERIFERVAAVQRRLDAGRFRAMVPLGGDHSDDPTATNPQRLQALHADVSGDAVRIVDPSSSSVIWQGYLGVSRPEHSPKHSEECGGWTLNRMVLWWDPATKNVLSIQDYHTGGCLCGDDTVEQVLHIETP